jgi:hypothetical protein
VVDLPLTEACRRIHRTSLFSQSVTVHRVDKPWKPRKIGLSRRGLRRRLGILKAKNILQVTSLIVILAFSRVFPLFPRKKLSVRGVNSYLIMTGHNTFT